MIDRLSGLDSRDFRGFLVIAGTKEGLPWQSPLC
jgi:hypothetical protein